ncbi:MAG TPA: alpha/beta fold hydrolase [Fimbriimonadaceae bacterium]|nr:alpha/beta fold hydrolase [Fimbriimonadaceae bacterium]
MRWSVPVRGSEAPVLADDEGPETLAILAHGAGSSMEQKTMEWLAGIVRQSGARVVRFNFLYRAEGRGMPDRMPVLMETYAAVLASARERLSPSRVIIGGHSMGGRVASMLEAEGRHADGLLLFGYPLHPAGQPEKLRDAHLPAIQTPTLQFNGTEDALCTRELMEAVSLPASWTLHWIEGADHSYAVKKQSGRTRAEVAQEIREALAAWMTPPNESSNP